MMNDWNGDHVATLKDLRTKGWSANQIARELNRLYKTSYTRNAVIGKACRLQLHFNKAAAPQRIPATPKAPPVKKGPPNPVGGGPGGRKFKQWGFETAKFGAPASPVPTPPQPLPERVEEPGDCTIHSLKDHHCRWPIGDTYCGKRKTRGAYCEGHAAVAYMPQSETRRRDLARDLRRYI